VNGEPWSDPNGTDLTMDIRKNSQLQCDGAASTAVGFRLHGKIPRQPAQIFSTLAVRAFVTCCFHDASLKSVPFWSVPEYSLCTFNDQARQ